MMRSSPTRTNSRSKKIYLRVAALLLLIGAYGVLSSSGRYALSESRQPTRLEYDADGLVRRVKVESNTTTAGRRWMKRDATERMALDEHPIFELVDKGKRDWAALMARQSRTLPQAVLEYRNRYKRRPPKGFEQWWHFCRRNNVKIVDDYDQIDRDIQPFFALSPKVFRQRVHSPVKDPPTFFIHLSPTSASYKGGERNQSQHARQLFNLLEPIAQNLPTNITIHHADHGLGTWLLDEDLRLAAQDAVNHRRFLTDEVLATYEKGEGRSKHKDTVSSCPKGSPAWKRALTIQAGDQWLDENTEDMNFIHDPKANSDFCQVLKHLNLHPQLADDFPRQSSLRPIFQSSKLERCPEFLSTPLQAYRNRSASYSSNEYIPWDEKSKDKLFWRGEGKDVSGMLWKDVDWRKSHGARLHLMAHASEGERQLWVQRGQQWVKESWEVSQLDEYLDVGLTGGSYHCQEGDLECEETLKGIEYRDKVAPAQEAKYKYMLDVDGDGTSSNLHSLLNSGSVVLRSSIFPEWQTDWMIPWFHYIPIQTDYSDIYPIMSFFLGPPDNLHHLKSHGKHKPDPNSHDEIARSIAENGKKFAEEHWRWVDMQAYMFRLILEYARLEADDRDEWSYDKDYK